MVRGRLDLIRKMKRRWWDGKENTYRDEETDQETFAGNSSWRQGYYQSGD
jgi:hypothetical protein